MAEENARIPFDESGSKSREHSLHCFACGGALGTTTCSCSSHLLSREALANAMAWAWRDGSALTTRAENAEVGAEPIPMILYCPQCHEQHVDEPDERTPEWDNPPHRSHLCHGCGCIWRPADVATEGVRSIKTAGERDTWGWDGASTALQPPPSTTAGELRDMPADDEIRLLREALTIYGDRVRMATSCRPDLQQVIDYAFEHTQDRPAFGGDSETRPSTTAGREEGSDFDPVFCSDCPPVGYPTDKTRCEGCPRVAPGEGS